jgi:predicted phage-related endonuclease
MALHRYRISKPTHGSGDWLNARFWDDKGNKRVSASAAAAIYGLHPFVPMDTYAAELMSDVPPQPVPPNEAMERGNRLEDPIMQWASDRLGITFATPDEMFVAESKGGARMIATLDGFFEEGDTRKVLEIKTTTKTWEGELPDYWRIQGIQQAICSDVEEITWAVFDPSMRLYLHTQTITPAEQAEHISAVEKWLNAIDLGMTPSGVKWSYETISTRYPKSEPKTVELAAEIAEELDSLRLVISERKALQELEDQKKARICELMGDADTATINGTTVATWKGQVRESLDIKAFKAACPDIAKQFSKQVTTRTFLLKGSK